MGTYKTRHELQAAHYFALAAKGNDDTIFQMVTREQLEEAIHDPAYADRFELGRLGVHWKGLKINKCFIRNRVHVIPGKADPDLHIPCKWNEFKADKKTGLCNKDQEQKVCDGLNAIAFLGKKWVWTANRRGKGYKADITSEDGEFTIEVKGFDGYLYVLEI